MVLKWTIAISVRARFVFWRDLRMYSYEKGGRALCWVMSLCVKRL